MEPISAPTATPEEQFQAISALLDQGVDPSILDETATEDGPTRPGAMLPGDGEDVTLKLTDRERVDLELYLCEVVDRYFEVMEGRHEIEQEIQNSYKMVSDPQSQGRGPSPSEVESEITMSLTDQAAARITSTIMGVEPLARVTPIDGADQEALVGIETAAATERFFHEYSMRAMNMRLKLPLAILRTCKVGTCVLKAEWRKKKKWRWKTEQDIITGKTIRTRIPKIDGWLNVQLVPNRHVIVWPPNIVDWQEDYELVGQEEFYAPARWKAMAAQLGLDDETQALIDAQPGGDMDFLGEESQENNGISPTAMRESMPMVKLTELWCDMVIPGRPEPERFQVILHRPTRKILWIDYNRFDSQKHPFYPIRYKLNDELAWGDGLGHEVRQHQAVGTALRNLRLDSLKAGAYWVILRRSGWVHETLTDRVMPGQVIPVDDVEADFKTVKMGGEVPEIDSAEFGNMSGAREASGQSPVLSGMGDPVQKSGTGTGATVALIEQAGKKFGNVDATIRNDLSAFYMFCLETIAQFAPEGVYYRCANEQDARILMQLRWTPPQGDIGSLYHIWAQAPSAENSKEARKQSLVMASQYLQQHLTTWLPQAQAILQQENPAALDRLNRSVIDFQRQLTVRVIEDYDLPGIKDQIPDLPEPIPEDQAINQLMQQLQQMQQAYDQLVAQVQQQMGGMAPPPPVEGADAAAA